MVALKVFISYSWDSNGHKQWVKTLADKLLNDGVEAVIDQYDTLPGDRLPQFMETIPECDYVLVICTPKYKEKADKRDGGVGYESHIISAELFAKSNDRKFIPVLRDGDFSNAMPKYLSGKLGIDLREINPKVDEAYQDLITTIRGERKKPEVKKGHAVADSAPKEETKSTDTQEELHITGIITDEVTLPRNDGTRGSALYKVPFRLSERPSSIWKQLFVQCWDAPLSFSTMHRPGIASVVRDKIILDGTTIEEVQKYHRDTLVACVKRANQQEKAYIEKQNKEKAARKKFEEEHNQRILEISNKIKF